MITSDSPAHIRVVQPPPPGGMDVLVVLFGGAGNPLEHALIPVDSTLPTEPAILSQFPRPRTITVEAVAPPTSCQSCHPTAHASWSASGHAKPWVGLPEADRVDECMSCHITVRPGRTAIPGVSCTACHVGAEAHAVLPSMSPGVVADCRTCHDGRHDPGFDFARSFGVLKHGNLRGNLRS